MERLDKTMVEYVVYKITSPSGKVYIGQTNNLENRIKRYKGHHCKSQFTLYSSFEKYGFKAHFIDVLYENLCKERANHFEILEISKYKNKCNSLNILKGGSIGGSNTIKVLKFNLKSEFICSYNSILEASKSIRSSEVALGKAILNKTNYCDGFFWEKSSNYINGTVFKKGLGIKIYQFNSQKKIINEFLSSGEASKRTGFSQTHILKKSKSLTDNFFNGYYWSDIIDKELIKLPKEFVYQYDVENNLINKFDSIRKASRETKTDRTSIYNCITNKFNKANGFIWKRHI